MIPPTGVIGDHRKKLVNNTADRVFGLSSPEKEDVGKTTITRLLDHISHKKDFMCLPSAGIPI